MLRHISARTEMVLIPYFASGSARHFLPDYTLLQSSSHSWATKCFHTLCQIMSWFIEQEASSAKSLYPSKHRNSTAEGALLFEAVGTFLRTLE